MNDVSEKLKKLDSSKLIDTVKNYRQYGYDEALREEAISILLDRGITKEQLELTGNYQNLSYDNAGILYGEFGRNSKYALLTYIMFWVANIFLAMVKIDPGNLTMLVGIISIVFVILYFVFLVKSFISQSRFYKIVGEDIVLTAR